MTNGWYRPICYRQLGLCPRHLSPHLEPSWPHLARHPRRLAPYRQRPSLSPRCCERSSAAPQMPFSPLLVSTCPTFVDCPRCLCFRSTSSGTFLNRIHVNEGKPAQKSTHSFDPVSHPWSPSR